MNAINKLIILFFLIYSPVYAQVPETFSQTEVNTYLETFFSEDDQQIFRNTPEYELKSLVDRYEKSIVVWWEAKKYKSFISEAKKSGVNTPDFLAELVIKGFWHHIHQLNYSYNREIQHNIAKQVGAQIKDDEKEFTEKELEKHYKRKTNIDSSEDCECDATAYITKSPKNGVELFNEEREVIKRITFDAENEEFLRVKLKGYTDNMFQISSLANPFHENQEPDEYSNLWIEKRHLSVFLPDRKGKVEIYSEPNEKSKILYKVTTGERYSIQVIKCCNGWVYGIHSNKKGKLSKGWFHPDDICSSPVANC